MVVVTVFNSSRVPEPFLDSVLLEKIRRRQREGGVGGGREGDVMRE